MMDWFFLLPLMLCLPTLLFILVAVILIRGLLFRPKPQKEPLREEVAFNEQAAVEALQKLVQCKTVSYHDPAVDMTAEERKSIHGNNERIRLESIGRAVEFYIRLMKQC